MAEQERCPECGCPDDALVLHGDALKNVYDTIAKKDAELAAARAALEAAEAMRDEHVERVDGCPEFDAALAEWRKVHNG